MRAWILAALLSALPGPALAAAPQFRVLDPKTSELDFTVRNSLHAVQGSTHQLQGAVRRLGDVEQVEVRADASGFHTRDTTRDEDLESTIDPARFPAVTFKGVIRGAREPAKLPATVHTMVDGELQFHGRSQRLRAPVTLTFSAGGRSRATTDFDIDLGAFGIRPPTLLFSRIRDRCHIHASLDFTPSAGLPHLANAR